MERAPPGRLACPADPVSAREASVEVVGVVGAPPRRRGRRRRRWRGGRLAGDVCVVAWSVPAGAVAPQDHGLQLDDSIGARELLGAEVDRDVRPDRRPVHRAVCWAPYLRRVGQCVCAVTRRRRRRPRQRGRGVEGDQAEIVPRVVRPLALPYHPSTQALHQAVAAAPVPAVGAVGAPCTERVGSAKPAVVALAIGSIDALVCAASGCGAGAISNGEAAAERARNPRGARVGGRRGGRVAGGGRGHVAPDVGEAVVGAAHGVGQDIAAVPVVIACAGDFQWAHGGMGRAAWRRGRRRCGRGRRWGGRRRGRRGRRGRQKGREGRRWRRDLNVGADPAEIVGDARVHPGATGLGAAEAPAHDPDLDAPRRRLGVVEERPARVAQARVLTAREVPRTKHPFVDAAQECVARRFALQLHLRVLEPIGQQLGVIRPLVQVRRLAPAGDGVGLPHLCRTAVVQNRGGDAVGARRGALQPKQANVCVHAHLAVARMAELLLHSDLLGAVMIGRCVHRKVVSVDAH